MSVEDKIITLKSSLIPSLRRKAAEELFRHEDLIDEKVVKALCEALSDNDNGVRDIISTNLINLNPKWYNFICENIVDYITSDRIEIRNLVSEIILAIKPTNVYVLTHYFDNPDPDVVKFAIDLVGLIANGEYIDVVLEKIDHPDANVRCSVVEAIGNIFQNNESVDYNKQLLIQRFEELYWLEEDLKPFIIEALGKIGGKEAEEFLISLINNENNFFLRVAAVDALAICGSDIFVCYKLLDMFESVNDELKILFLKTIYAISFRIGQPIELPDKYRFVAQLALLENDPDTYGAGLVALGNDYRHDDIPYLLRLIFRNDGEINHFMVRNLMNSTDPSIIEEFIKQFFVKYDPSDSENLDFLAYFTIEAPSSPSNNLKALIKSLVKHTIFQKPVFWENIITFCLEISTNITIAEIQKNYDICDLSEKAFIEEILSKFDISLTNDLV